MAGPPAEDLINAALHGDAAAVQALLAKGAEVNAKANDGVTALMAASEEGHGEVVEALLAKGAEVNARRTNDGVTALILASYKGHIEVVQALLAKELPGINAALEQWRDRADGGRPGGPRRRCRGAARQGRRGQC